MLLKDIESIKNKNVDVTKLMHKNKVIWQSVYLDQSGDFFKVNGFWIYRGAELEVEIPTHINGELVTSTHLMFSGSAPYNATPVTKVVLRHSNVITMNGMFSNSRATTLDLSSFNTLHVTSMFSMFNGSKATTLDLSGFDTSKVSNTIAMFQSSSATTGYARTQADANKFNASTHKPNGLTFVVK